MEQFIGSEIVNSRPAYKVTMSKPGCPGQTAIMVEGNSIDGIETAVANGWTITDKLEGYETVYRDGFRFWSPKEDFEKVYRRTDGLNFGLALEAAKMGKRIARKGWNGKGMYVFLIDVADLHTDADLSGLEGKNVTVRECFAMKCADDSICPGWLASQTDMLADDWCIVQ